MKGHPQVIEHLNALLVGELTAIDQYFIHSRMYQDWGFHKLHERIGHEMTEEQTHADLLIKRTLFLEGIPDLSKRDTLTLGKSVPEMLRNDLALEYLVIARLKEVIKFCESVQDYETRHLLMTLLEDSEEDHAYWLETQLRLIENIGLQNYLQSQT